LATLSYPEVNVIEEEVAQCVAKDRVELQTTRIFHQPLDQIFELAHSALCARKEKYKNKK
jgi:hypothetical protein